MASEGLPGCLTPPVHLAHSSLSLVLSPIHLNYLSDHCCCLKGSRLSCAGTPRTHGSVYSAADSDTDSAASASPIRGPASPGAFHSTSSSLASGSTPGSTAAFVLVASHHTLRVYAMENVVAANRTTLRKAQIEEKLVAVAPFVTPAEHSPGVVSLSAKGTLQVCL